MKFIILCVLALVLFTTLTLAINEGTDAQPDQFNFIVRLALNLVNNKHSSCGGCIIASNFILTAAHCLHRIVQSVDIYFDTIKRNTAPLIVHVEKSKFIIHSQFSPRSMRNDIALIGIPYDNTNTYITPIALPKNDFIDNDGENIIVLGWGRMGNTDETTEDLQFATMQTMPIERCIDMYGPYLVRNNSNICIKSEDTASICPGDSGGPAVRITVSGTEELVGLASFGTNKTCQHGMPAVLTSVYKHLQWISEKTNIVF